MYIRIYIYINIIKKDITLKKVYKNALPFK